MHLKGHFMTQHKLNICLCSVTFFFFFFLHILVCIYSKMGYPTQACLLVSATNVGCFICAEVIVGVSRLARACRQQFVCTETCLWSTTHVEKPLWLRFPQGYFAFIASLKMPGSNRYDSKPPLNLLNRLYKPSVSDVPNLFRVLALFILFKWCSMTCEWCCVVARSARLSHF